MIKRNKQREYEYCTRCGKPVYRYPRKRIGRPFCSRQCNLKTLNEELNPDRMTLETRAKLREARLNTGAGKTYSKFHGVHTHRVVAALMLGRDLLPEEVVHHIDGDRRNNDPRNLRVFANQAEHAKWHSAHEGGDAL